MSDKKPVNHIRLTSHPDSDSQTVPIRWADPEPLRRGPVVAMSGQPAACPQSLLCPDGRGTLTRTWLKAKIRERPRLRGQPSQAFA